MDDIVGTSALDGKFTIQEDEEQLEKLAEILKLLVSAGYFRAKIQGLSAFDKVVGGMVFCISTCAEAVDVDLLYSENSSIGQKIALTENIVKVLPKFKCPHSIEPHQIQGLDCIRIFPVIAWLVNETIEAKKKHGDEILRFSAYQFENSKWSIEGVERGGSKHVKDRAEKPRPKRIFTRREDMQTGSLEDDVRCTLLEYGLETSDVVVRGQMTDEDNEPGREKRKQIEAQFLENLQIAEKLKSGLRDVEPTTKKVSARAMTEMIDSSRLGRIASDFDELKSVIAPEDEAIQLQKANFELEHRLEALKEEASQQTEMTNQTREQLNALKERILDYGNILEHTSPETLEEAKRLLSECKQLRSDEQTYKRECRAQMIKIEEEIERLKSRSDDQSTKENIMIEDAEHIAQLSKQLANINREVFYLSRKIDARPTQIEFNQYQRRFVELYNLVTAKHLEARQLCVYHNSLLDICAFVRQEVALLNNIDDQKNLALANSYKTSFMQNLEDIVRGINESLNKISTKKQESQARRDKLTKTVQELQDRKRNYHKAVAEFQEECQVNEQLIGEEETLNGEISS